MVDTLSLHTLPHVRQVPSFRPETWLYTDLGQEQTLGVWLHAKDHAVSELDANKALIPARKKQRVANWTFRADLFFTS